MLGTLFRIVVSPAHFAVWPTTGNIARSSTFYHNSLIGTQFAKILGDFLGLGVENAAHRQILQFKKIFLTCGRKQNLLTDKTALPIDKTLLLN